MITKWWRLKRKTDHPIWHFMNACEVLPFDPERKFIVVEENPTSGTKCDFCQYAQKREQQMKVINP